MLSTRYSAPETSEQSFPAQSGQRKPTAASCMQSVQIGRPHCAHEKKVSRDACR